MNPAVEQMLDTLKKLPTSRKVILAVVVLLAFIAFSSLFFMANKSEYQAIYKDLSAEDASEMVDKLREKNIHFKLSNEGSTLMVSSDKVYAARIALASAGLPKGTGVGFEIFDKTDFGTTEFVQKLNYQRALQGELGRTIKEFEEVIDARVMIVLPKDSVFVEETKPPSASVLLKLRSKLSKEKIEAVLHLVASSIEDLTPDLVSVVDTTGNVLSKGTPEDDLEVQANTQLEYKMSFERNLTTRIQTMLEKIVGAGKAIVRVSADMDFSQVNTSEELYDPDVQVVRSRQNVAENAEKKNGPAGKVSTVNPVVPPENRRDREMSEKKQRNDDTVNYEINKTLRTTVKPLGVVKRLSVAAVLDGTYKIIVNEDGSEVKKYFQRTPIELDQFTVIVKQAMGYSADREDQVSVESMAFVGVDELLEDDGLNWRELWKEYGNAVINIILVIFLFVFVVRPIIKTVKSIYAPIEDVEPEPEPEEVIPEPPPKPKVMTLQERATVAAKKDIEKTANIVRGWLSEGL